MKKLRAICRDQSGNDIEKGEPFTQEDIDKLWQHKKDPAARIVLMMIYSGFRISAYETIEINLEEQYFKGGVKTRAGKNRIVPFHHSIIPFAKAFRPKKFNGDAFRRHEFYPLLKNWISFTAVPGKAYAPRLPSHLFMAL